MTKSTVHQIRLSEQEKQTWRDTQTAGGWVSIADMVRSLVIRAQSQQPQPQIEQPQPDHQHEQPPL